MKKKTMSEKDASAALRRMFDDLGMDETIFLLGEVLQSVAQKELKTKDPDVDYAECVKDLGKAVGDIMAAVREGQKVTFDCKDGRIKVTVQRWWSR